MRITAQSKDKGFSLIEMLVVISIFVVITLIVLTRNNSFYSTILLRTLAYEVALSVREAQVYGLGAREAENADPGEEFTTAHGIEVDLTESNTSYHLSADSNGNGVLETSERIITHTLNRGFSISDICGSPSNQQCDDNAGKISIIFRRPDPSAVITWDNLETNTWVYTEISVQAPDSTTRRVSVNNVGQIAVLD